MRLTRRAVAAAVAYFFLQSLALSVAVSDVESEHHALLAEMSLASRVEDRRSLRKVHVGSPQVSESRSRTGGGLGVGAIIGIVVSSVCFVLVVAVAVVWMCRMRRETNPEWGSLGSFKRRNPKPVVDEEKLFAQAKGDTHLSVF